jgi:hypothetical protein
VHFPFAADIVSPVKDLLLLFFGHCTAFSFIIAQGGGIGNKKRAVDE